MSNANLTNTRSYSRNYWHRVGYSKAHVIAGVVAERHGTALGVAVDALNDADRAIRGDVVLCLDVWDDDTRAALAEVLARIRKAAAIVEAVAHELEDFDHTTAQGDVLRAAISGSEGQS